MNVLDSTLAVSRGSDRCRKLAGRSCGLSGNIVPASTSCAQRRSYSAAEPSHHSTRSGWVRRAIRSTHSTSARCLVGASLNDPSFRRTPVAPPLRCQLCGVEVNPCSQPGEAANPLGQHGGALSQAASLVPGFVAIIRGAPEATRDAMFAIDCLSRDPPARSQGRGFPPPYRDALLRSDNLGSLSAFHFFRSG